MKRKFMILSALLLAAVFLTSCASDYFLDEVIPELIDISTQYPHVEKVTVTNGATGESVEYTDPKMQDNIRMIFEGVQCTRSKGSGVPAEGVLFTVTFHTVDGDTVVEVLSQSSYVIGEYTYKAITFGVDTVYLENLFAE
ncbi:MAG: hypothetical protein IJV76_06875 [Clostridia bacterium]|nr:hypothetical protein [Clostridia bacterium]